MTNRNPLIRPAMTAIAAVLACSTPSFAQSADPLATETPSPVVATPADPAPVTETPIVPDTPVAADTLAPAEAEAAPATRRATTARPAPVRSRPAPARAASAAPAPAAAAPAPAAASVPPAAEAPIVEPLPVEPEAAPVVAPVETAEASSDGMMMALAAGAIAILALAGAAVFLRRRKRHAAEAEDLAMRDAELDAIHAAEPAMMVEPEPVQVQPAFAPAPALAATAAPVIAAPALATKAAPVVAAAPPADPTPDADGPVTELPEDFDLSRFGYNVQEAYKGPTEDNPSLSMKNRLTRARGMDQLERNLDAEVEAATGEPVLTEDELNPPAEAPAAETTTAPQGEGVSPPSTPGERPALRPAYPE